MHPGAGNYDNTIVNALINYKKNSLSSIGDELRPGIVHRIDKNTSGLVVIAKNNQAHENLSIQFSKHSITRIYQLLIWGKVRPSKGKIETFITRSSKNRQLMEVSNTKGKKAELVQRLESELKNKGSVSTTEWATSKQSQKKLQDLIQKRDNTTNMKDYIKYNKQIQNLKN